MWLVAVTATALMLAGSGAVINAEPIAPAQVAAAVAAATGTGEIPAHPAGTTTADSNGAYDASANSIDAPRSTSPAATAAEPPTTAVPQPQPAADGGHQKVSVTADGYVNRTGRRRVRAAVSNFRTGDVVRYEGPTRWRLMITRALLPRDDFVRVVCAVPDTVSPREKEQTRCRVLAFVGSATFET